MRSDAQAGSIEFTLTTPAFVEKAVATLAPGQAFDPGWHLQAIGWQLERVRRGEITRLITNMPPRSLKSIMASVAFPAFLLGHDPTQSCDSRMNSNWVVLISRGQFKFT